MIQLLQQEISNLDKGFVELRSVVGPCVIKNIVLNALVLANKFAARK